MTRATYLDALRAGDARRALEVIDDLIDAGVSFDELCEDVIRPALYEIGDLWESGRIGVADEHLASAISETVLALVGSISTVSLDARPRVVVCCSEGEAHALGARMVAEAFAAADWSVQFLGASTPPDAVAAAVVERHADVLAMSTAMSANLPAVQETIAAVREASSEVRIVVGGRAYGDDPELAEKVGADLFHDGLTGLVDTVEGALTS